MKVSYCSKENYNISPIQQDYIYQYFLVKFIFEQFLQGLARILTESDQHDKFKHDVTPVIGLWQILIRVFQKM
ncbi:hypothetical protein JNUCC42_01875 [Brevibacterium sp. JNUCC-42]|nr:hypothetical protein JNUCC42_01875 [Brevibacterium sp. JNUCC-42]